MATTKPANPFKALLNRLPPYVKNRYFLTLAAFTAFMIFVDRHDILTQFQLRSVVDRLEEDQGFYEEKIKEAEAERLDRELNKERFARETYYMQRDNEDVFIIVPETEEE